MFGGGSGRRAAGDARCRMIWPCEAMTPRLGGLTDSQGLGGRRDSATVTERAAIGRCWSGMGKPPKSGRGRPRRQPATRDPDRCQGADRQTDLRGAGTARRGPGTAVHRWELARHARRRGSSLDAAGIQRNRESAASAAMTLRPIFADR